MLEHLPHWLGSALSGLRAGADKLTIARLVPSDAATLSLSSTAFADGGRIPDRFTADGEGVSPPLSWGPPPAGTETLLLIVEDPDAPAARPLVHAIVAGLPPEAGGIAEGGIAPDGDGDAGGDTGRNSFRREGWLPPDPPNGHGAHHYVFQLLALGAGAPLEPTPDRGDVVDALRERPILAAGLLTGIYSRGEPADIGPLGAADDVPGGALA
ncbi:YbhB/YbcL family Raf kinase inhibitor-like protein [Sphingomonas ginkgonis]|uniref:YbhB/YbcL family Raf kinase inhibitor-like protein n=1 Tax=Sphingomonas ginkgonis TaxID=2315330 RepID=A0A429V7C1_9SPHN|nr:YbhB/YbcL family Raf kinase inhibitor-like protein [Sphingomonas ginkgonis]RST29824.1 YbhB/YbcL family Raf kinase inhibitor-like protein [Sphingomonas ginkgonis]